MNISSSTTIKNDETLRAMDYGPNPIYLYINLICLAN